MENEEFFAREPEVDAQVRARELSEQVTENSRLLPTEASHGQSHLTGNRSRWREPSVSVDGQGPKSFV